MEKQYLFVNPQNYSLDTKNCHWSQCPKHKKQNEMPEKNDFD